ncbi:hypothetical protein [Mangrovibacterium marinum]|uniref:Limiting CO2-inducible protein B/C beta carbonyic anhydrase domain-containing protein n=1 Tax=Mangrovibacterium marinum TaxID=1639118 RepID=A0A2T5C0Q9_9BACT|nr:hypothetical protein [Mangrovibacterium marinum]PTN08186.1 hypothetical protein C8N47_11072 [Mangrovibacterium marinum]
MNKTIERIHSLFPGAAPFEDVLDDCYRQLKADYQLMPKETIAAYSLCPDELNNPVVEKIRELFGPAFALGGISGYPFTGVTGFNAFGDHIPDGGNAFIFYGPHIGIDAARNGYVHRVGQQRDTLSCGAALGAYQQLVESGGAKPELNHADYQQWRIKQMFLPHLNEIPQLAPELKLVDLVYGESHAFVLEQAARIKEQFNARRMFLLGGVVLNTPLTLADYIQLRSFDVLE